MHSGLTLMLMAGPTLTVALMLWFKKKRDSKLAIYSPQTDETDLEGKIVIVTGASSGLGRETALELAKRKATVILACRDIAKGEKAKDYILSKVENDFNSENLHLLHLDLSSLDSVEEFIEEFKSKFTKLDILVNNAGIMAAPFLLSNDGIELHFATNHLGHFHLTNLLLDSLRSGAPSRIVNVSSGYYRKMKEAKFDDVRSTTKPMDYDPYMAYARSKLANNLHAVELSKRLKSSQISVYAMHPGFVSGTELGRHFPPLFYFLASPMIWYFSKNIHQGIQTILYCCLEDENNLKSGSYYGNCEQEQYTDLVTDKAAKDLWDLSCRLVSELKSKNKKND